jgi:CDP-glucose 4,6-dehydratase
LVKTALESQMASNDFWTEKCALVSGATGLVGSWLVESLLERGAKPVCLVRDFVPDSRFFSEGFDKKVSIVHGSLEDFWTIERTINEYEPDVVFHLGAQSQVLQANRSPLPTFEANIRGTWNLLEACRLHGNSLETVVVASSDKAYGDQEKLPYTEDMPLQGRNPYDVSKSCCDLLSQSYAKTYKWPVVISRCGNFFGGGDLNFKRIVPGTIRSLYNGTPPVIRSDGKYVRDYIYVKDAVSAYLALAEKYSPQIAGEAFNFSNETQLSVLEMVGLIAKLMKRENIKPVVRNEPLNEIRAQHLSAKKAAKMLGWKAKYGLERGLKETVDWYVSGFEARRKK